MKRLGHNTRVAGGGRSRNGMGLHLKRGTAGAGNRRSLRRLAWLAVALVLSLSLMPLSGRLSGPLSRPSQPGSGHHHHHHGHAGAALADADAGAGHAGRHLPAGQPSKGCAGHEGCPFCTAHPGYSPPPPQMTALPSPAVLTVAAGPMGGAGIVVSALQFLTSLRPRAPPSAPV